MRSFSSNAARYRSLTDATAPEVALYASDTEYLYSLVDYGTASTRHREIHDWRSDSSLDNAEGAGLDPLYTTTELPGSSGAGTNLLGQESDDLINPLTELRYLGLS